MTKDTTLLMDRRQLLVTTAGAATLLLVAPMSEAASEPGPSLKPGRLQPFDPGWRFHRGESEGSEAPGFDDNSWRMVDVPHDWSIEDLPPQPAEAKPGIIGPFDRNAEGGTATGFAVGGDGWYRTNAAAS